MPRTLTQAISGLALAALMAAMFYGFFAGLAFVLLPEVAILHLALVPLVLVGVGFADPFGAVAQKPAWQGRMLRGFASLLLCYGGLLAAAWIWG